RLQVRVDGEATRVGSRLPLILAPPSRTVGSLGGTGHRVKHDLTDPHAGVEFHCTASQVRKFESDLAVETRIDEASGRVYDDGDASNAAAPFDSRDEIGRHAHSLDRTAQGKLPRVQGERLSFLDDEFLGVARDRLRIARIDTGNVGKLVDDEPVAQSEIDARWLDLKVRVVEGRNADVAPFEANFQVPVRENHDAGGYTTAVPHQNRG